MGWCRRIREGNYPQHLRAFPIKNLILTHYMLSACWLNILDGLGHHVICPGSIEQVMVMNNNIMILGYTYAKLRLNNPPRFVKKLTHTGRIIAWIPSRLAWNPSLLGRDWSLKIPSPPHSIFQNEQPEGSNHFLQFYAVHAMGLRVHSFYLLIIMEYHYAIIAMIE